jgi:hypothetical protein
MGISRAAELTDFRPSRADQRKPVSLQLFFGKPCGRDLS